MEDYQVSCYFPKKNDETDKDLQRFANLVRDLVLKYYDKINCENDEKVLVSEKE